MVLNQIDLFNNGFFSTTPEDGQVGTYEGNRIVYEALPTQSDALVLTPIQSALNILQLQIAAAITPESYTGIITDIFNDSTGYFNTVDTASSNAAFITDRYSSFITASDAHGVTINDSSVNGSERIGLRFSTNYPITVNQLIIKSPAGTVPTVAYILDSAKNVLYTSSFVGLTASFTSAMLNSGSTYYMACDNTGSTYRKESESVGVSYPYNKTNINYLGGMINTTDDSRIYAFTTAITTRTDDAIIKTVPITIASGFENFHAVAFRASTSNSATITGDFSFDNEANWVTGQSLNLNHSIEYTGTTFVAKFNLKKNSIGNATASCKGFGIQLW